MIAMLRRMSLGEATAAAVLLAVLILTTAVSCVAGLQRPLTTKEKIYQAGGVLQGLGQELTAAVESGQITGETAKTLILAFDTTQKIYRQAAQYAIQKKDQDAATAYAEALKAIRTLTDALIAAGVRL